ncbi:hypothetical protein NL676_013484 [Syzygium grande]|nr:hypothetical protein NL676_013484 [Syzygium grande]
MSLSIQVALELLLSEVGNRGQSSGRPANALNERNQMVVGELCLGVFLQALFDRLASCELLSLLRQQDRLGIEPKPGKRRKIMVPIRTILEDTEETNSLLRCVAIECKMNRLSTFPSKGNLTLDGGGRKGGGSGGDGGDGSGSHNRIEALLALAEVSRTLDSIPKDLATAIQAGKFGGFRERLLADELFLAKVAMECGVGIFTKSAAELERRREKFTKELDFVFADVVMAIIADFMLVWLPAHRFSSTPLAVNAGALSTFFYGCPDNAFQNGE